jgi:hypothetical protein
MKIISYIIVGLMISGLFFIYQITPYMNLNEGLDTIYFGEVYNDPGATLRVGNDYYEMTPNDEIDVTQIGKQTILYTYTFEGKLYSISRHVMVIEHEQFFLKLNPGIDTISIGDAWVDAGVTTSHDVNVEVISTLNRLRAGTYEIRYQVTYLDELYHIIRYVTVTTN